jgi:dipeptidyl aminopeptidase/acylaminoacyl peptidase
VKLLLFVLFLPAVLRADLTVDEAIQLRTVSAVAISPDGTLTAYAVSIPDIAGNRHVSQIYIGDRKLVEGSAPAWSPDGATIACLRRGQIWRIRAAGGEAEKLTGHTQPVERFAWSPDGKFLAFLSQDTIPPTDPTIVGVNDTPMVRLWLLDIATGKERLLTPGNYSVGGYEQWFPDGISWSPDSRRIAFSRRPDARAGSHLEADVVTVGIQGGEPEYLVRRDGMDANPRWSPRGDWLGFISTGKVDWVTISNLFLVSPKTHEIRNVSREFDESVKNFTWTADGSKIFFIAGQKTAEVICSLNVPAGNIQRLTSDGAVYSHLSLSRDGRRAAFVRQDAETPPEVYVSGTDEIKPERISRINSQVAPQQIPETRVVRWRSFDGMEIEGVLAKPVGYRSGRRYPLLVVPHGGPHSVVTNSFFPFREAWLMANRGWAVFLPNFRGSGNYGERFLRANLDGWGVGDFRDVMTGIDHLIETGIADGDRLAISGASYGGYMTAWSITQTTRFRAAVVGCAITDLVSFFGTTDVRTRFENYLGADPHQYVRLSPVQYVDRVRTPALIWHGDQDPRVPPGQGRELYSALKHHSVAVEMLIVHGEGHGLKGPRHQRDLLEREVQWLQRWVPD